MPEDTGVSEFAKKVVSALEKERPRPRWEQEVMGIRPDLFPELDGRITTDHTYKKPIPDAPYEPPTVMSGGLPARKFHHRGSHDIGTAPDGSVIPDDPFQPQGMPGNEGAWAFGDRYGKALKPYIPEGIRDAGSKIIAGYGNWARSHMPSDETQLAAHDAVNPILEPETLKRVGDGLESKAREMSPQYKYDRSLQEYIRAMRKAGAITPIDGGELD